MRKSQRANHAIMEIQNIHAIRHSATGCLCTWTSIEKEDEILENETGNKVLRILVISLI